VSNLDLTRDLETFIISTGPTLNDGIAIDFGGKEAGTVNPVRAKFERNKSERKHDQQNQFP
jgi:hypothetical protein